MLTLNQMKLIALSAMILDHLALFMPDVFPLWFRWIGRISYPLFLYCNVYGYIFSGNKEKLLLRIYLAAAAMELIRFFFQLENMNILRSIFNFCLLLYVTDHIKSKQATQKTILAYLWLQVLTGVGISFLKSSMIPSELSVIAGTAAAVIKPLSFIRLDYGMAFILLGLIMYKNTEKPKALAVKYISFTIGYVIVTTTGIVTHLLNLSYYCFGYEFTHMLNRFVDLIIGGSPWWRMFTLSDSFLYVNYQWMMIFALLPILLCRPRRQKVSEFEKYFYYIFYPLHLLVLQLG